MTKVDQSTYLPFQVDDSTQVSANGDVKEGECIEPSTAAMGVLQKGQARRSERHSGEVTFHFVSWTTNPGNYVSFGCSQPFDFSTKLIPQKSHCNICFSPCPLSLSHRISSCRSTYSPSRRSVFPPQPLTLEGKGFHSFEILSRP